MTVPVTGEVFSTSSACKLHEVKASSVIPRNGVVALGQWQRLSPKMDSNDAALRSLFDFKMFVNPLVLSGELKHLNAREAYSQIGLESILQPSKDFTFLSDLPIHSPSAA